MEHIMQLIPKVILSAMLILFAATAGAQESTEVFIGLGHGETIHSLDVSDDGRFAVTIAKDGFKFWNYEQGTLIKTIPISAVEGLYFGTASSADPKTLALSRNNKFIIYEYSPLESEYGESNIAIINIAMGKTVAEGLPLSAREYTVDRLLSPQGKLITLVGAGKVTVYEVATGKVVQSAVVEGTLDELAYSLDGSKVFFTTRKKVFASPVYFYSFDLAQGSARSLYASKIDGAQQVAISKDGNRAITVWKKRNIEIWDPSTGNRLRKNRHKESLLKKSSGASKVWLSDDGSIAIIEFYYQEADHIARSQYEYMILNTKSGDVINLLDYTESGMQLISISPNNEYIVFDPKSNSKKPNSIEIYDLQTHKRKILELKNMVWDLVFGAKDADLFMASIRSVERLDVQTGETILLFGEEMGPTRDYISTYDRAYLLSVDAPKGIGIGKPIKIPDELKALGLLALSPDSRSVVTSGTNKHTFKEFDLISESFIKTYGVADKNIGGYESVHSFRYTPDGKYLVAAYSNPNAAQPNIGRANNAYIQIWDVKTGVKVRKLDLESSSINGVDISPDGKFILAATNFQQMVRTSPVHWEVLNELVLFDLQTGQKVQTIAQNKKLHDNYWDPRFFPDGTKVMADATVWDVSSGSVIQEYEFDLGHMYGRVIISPDVRKFLLSRPGLSLPPELRNAKTGEIISALENASRYAYNSGVFSNDGSKIFIPGRNGELITYDANTGKELASSYVFADGEWVTITPDGYYGASAGGARHISVRVGMEVFSMDNFFDTYYRPDIVSAALRGGNTQNMASSDIRTDAELPPSVRFTSPSGNSTSPEQQLTLTAEITGRGGGIDEVRLFHNGKLISGGTRGLKLAEGGTNILTPEYKVNLLPGENTFRLTAFSSGQRIESNPEELLVKYEGTVATSDLYVLAVGINEYKNTTMNLNYGRPDAEAFTAAVERQSGEIFQSVNITTLYDEQATRAGLQSSFEDIIASARPQDAFLFFYAGHGVMSEPEDDRQGDFYMALSDVVQLYGNNAGLEAGGISGAEMTELSRRLPARKQMIVLDACQSGGAVQTFAMRGAAEQKAILQLARSAGLVVLASTGTEQYATEFQALGHGVFTYALLNGLSGKADGGSRDGKITVKELEAFINDRVPALTEQHRGQAQYPNSYARGQDFPIGVVQQ